MNYNKHVFTKEEFLALPEYELAKEAPVGVPFLLNSKIEETDAEGNTYFVKSTYVFQKEVLMSAIEQIQKSKIDELDSIKHQKLKVLFWKKHKDGRIGEFGGHIPMSTIIDDTHRPLASNTVIDLGDLGVPKTDELTFTA